MGFFKGLINKITGGGAKVQLDVDEASLGDAFSVKILADIADSDIKISKVYLYIRSTEHARFDNVEMRDQDGQSFVKDLEFDNEIFRIELVVSDAEVLKANQSYEWSVQVELPEEAAPSFTGKNIQHIWEFYAGLDTAGNDPDSGWIEVDVY